MTNFQYNRFRSIVFEVINSRSDLFWRWSISKSLFFRNDRIESETFPTSLFGSDLTHFKLILSLIKIFSAAHCCRGFQNVELNFGEFNNPKFFSRSSKSGSFRLSLKSNDIHIHPAYSTSIVDREHVSNNFDSCLIYIQ